MLSPKQQQLPLDSKRGRNDLTPHLGKSTPKFIPSHVDVWEQFGGDKHHLQHNQAPKQRKASVAWSEDFASGLGTDYDNFSVPPSSSPKPGYDNLPDTIPLNDTVQGYIGQLPAVDFSETASVFTARRSSPAVEDGGGDEEFLIEDTIGNLAILAEGLVDPYHLPRDPEQATVDRESTNVDLKCSHKQGSHQEEFEELLSDAAWEEIPVLKIDKSSKADDSNSEIVDFGQIKRQQALEDRISCSGEGDRANNPRQSNAVLQFNGKDKQHQATQSPQQQCPQDTKVETTPEQIESLPEMKTGDPSSTKRKQRPKPPLQFNSASQVAAGQPQAELAKPPVQNVSRHRASEFQQQVDSPVDGQGSNPADSKSLKKPGTKQAKSSATTSRRKGPKLVGKSSSVKNSVKVKDAPILKADSEASEQSSHVPELPPTSLPEPQHNDMPPPSINPPRTNVRTRGQAAAEATRNQHEAVSEEAVPVTADTAQATTSDMRSAKAIGSPPEMLSSPVIEDTYADNQILSDSSSPSDAPAIPNPIEVPSVLAVVVTEKISKAETAHNDGPESTEMTTADRPPLEKDGKAVFDDVIAIESDASFDSAISSDDDQSPSMEAESDKQQAAFQAVKLHDEYHDGDNRVREARHDAETGSSLRDGSTTLVQTRITSDNLRPQERKVYHQSTDDQTVKAGPGIKQHVESTGLTFPTRRKRVNESPMTTTKDTSEQPLTQDPGVKNPVNFREFASGRERQGIVGAEKPFMKPRNTLPLVQREQAAKKNLRQLRNKHFEERSQRQIRQLPRLKNEEQTLVNTPGVEIAHQLHGVVKLFTTRLDSATKAVDEVVDAYEKGTSNCLDRIDQRITKEFEALGDEWTSDARNFSRVAEDNKATLVSGNQSRRDIAGFFKSVSGDRQQLYVKAAQSLRSFERQILEGGF
ncbi:uncharacterized protein J7T54_007104 [Emericellopsis cladophorae]|uniref:Uncharacterized protein n=1 Tax=Emericellopsis cladophorae TaxID=2686198 RepID=A0A9Q0BGX0_9HYPO|nr:uncharacterized protein J7T54_007104 [Emericellopsis cladophorae]KAI6785462.1 hypothetical protein J7T54_007104 [Emericellopsis cladophorae]